MSGSGGACCVCERPLDAAEARTLGGRVFCAEHLERAARENRAAAGPLLVCIGAVVLFAALVWAAEQLTQARLGGVALLAAGIVMALVPGLIWLVAFYQQDRLEPEPKRLVLLVFLLGAVLFEAVARPITRDVFDVQHWLYASPLTALLGSILIVGFVQQFVAYAGLRYSVYRSPEFDERVDGIIYGAAFGLGFATLQSIRYVVDGNGVNLGVGAIQVSVAALSHASFTAVLGYFLARAKFERVGPAWLPAGLVLAATLDGVVSYALREIPQAAGFGYRPWFGLVLATVVAGGTFLVLFVAVRAQNAHTLAVVRQRQEVGG